MANTLAPLGFRPIGLVDGSPPNFGLAPGKAAYNASAMFSGDPLVISGGKLAAASTTGNTGAAVAGVAVSFSWNSIAQNAQVRQSYYPGSDSVNNADITVHYINNPNALFEVQVTSSSAGTAVGGPAVQADVGKKVNFATGAGGNTRSQQSSFSIDYSTATTSSTTLPFYIYNLEGAPRTDPTTAGNLIQVGFNTLSLAG